MKYLLIFSILFFFQMTFALPAKSVDGPHISVKKIIWAWMHRSDFLQSCLADKIKCGKADELQSYLLKISIILKNGQSTQIKFVSEKDNPDLFKSTAGETHRIAVTGSSVDSPIIFNLDRIQDLKTEQIIGIIYHELAHHIELDDDSFRKPDQIGARVAKHVSEQLKVSYLNEEKYPNIQSGVFQFAVPENMDGTNSFGNFGYITDGLTLIDLSFNSFEAYPACDRDDAAPMAQQIDGALSWSLSKESKVVVTTPIKNLCVWVDKVSKTAGSDIVGRGFIMRFDLDQDGRMKQDTIVTSLAQNIETQIDQVSTLQLIDYQLNHETFKAGETVEAKIKLKSFTELHAKDCTAGIAENSDPKQDNGWPVMDNVDSCLIISNVDSIWTIQIKYKIGDMQKSGQYSLPVIRLSGEDKSDVGFLRLLKNEIKFTVLENLKAVNKIQFVSIKSTDLTELNLLGEYPLKESYFYKQGSLWTIEIRVKSKLKISVRGFDASFLIALDGQLATSTQSGDLKDLSHYIKNVTYKTEGDIQVVRMSISLPERSNNLPVYGLNLLGFLLEDEAKNFLQFKKSENYQYLFISDVLLKSN